MRRIATLTLLVTLAGGAAFAGEGEKDSPLEVVAFFVGELQGQGKHSYGAYDETFTGKWILDKTAIEIRSKSTMGARTVYEDLRIISWDPESKSIRMRQFSKGLLREYSGKKQQDGRVVFEQTKVEGASSEPWRYTYTPGKDGGFSYQVHAKQAGGWKPFVSGTLTAHVKDPGKGGGMGLRQYDATAAGMSAQVHHPDGTGPFPAIVLSPGGGANTFQGYRPYGRWYATWGLVTVIVAFNDGSAKDRAPKFSKVLDWLVAENAREGSTLHRKIDTNRLAVAGHSRGGNAAVIAARADKRVRACLGLAPSGPTEAPEGEGSCPVCLIIGDQDRFLDAAKAAYGHWPGEKYLIVVQGLTHMLQPSESVLKLVARSTAFLNHALKGDERYQPLLVKPLEGLTITSAKK